MQAIIHKKYGPPEVLKIAKLPKPKPKNDQILIEIHAAGVNRTDTGLRSAEYFVSRFFTGLFKPKRQTTGTEFAGKVVEVGSKVNKFKVGDRVFGFDDTKRGAHAEYLAISQDKMIGLIPRRLNFSEAAALAEGSHYAQNYINAAKIKRGQSVLLNGASGAIGSAALQILKAKGVKVTATTCGKATRLATDLGADEVINYEKQDFTKLDQQFDCVLDAVGKSSFPKTKHLLKPKGIYMSSELGEWFFQNPYLAIKTAITSKFGSKRVLFPIPKNTTAHIHYVADLVKKGKYRPVIDKTFKFEDIVKAVEYVETGQKIGSVVLLIR